MRTCTAHEERKSYRVKVLTYTMCLFIELRLTSFIGMSNWHILNGRNYETVSNGPPKEFAVKRCFYPSRVAVTNAKEHPQFEHYSINPGTWLQSILRTLQERWRHLQQIFSPSAVLSTMPVTMCLATVSSTRTQERDIFLWSSFKHCKKCPSLPWDHLSEFIRMMKTWMHFG